MKDTLTIGTIAGIAGTIVLHLLSLVFEAFGLVKINTLQVSAAIFLAWSQVNTTVGFIVGAIVHLMIGATGGVLLAYFMRYSGKDYYPVKGLALAGFMLLGGMGLIIPVIGIVPQMRQDSLTVLFHTITFIAYGLSVSYIIARYADFSERPERRFKIKKIEKQSETREIERLGFSRYAIGKIKKRLFPQPSLQTLKEKKNKE